MAFPAQNLNSFVVTSAVHIQNQIIKIEPITKGKIVIYFYYDVANLYAAASCNTIILYYIY